MASIQSDITILDNLVALNLNIRLWSARRKMTPEDFGGVELPPEDLATLGSKRIADPEALKIFSTLKSRAFSYLDRHGVRFMSGWAIPETKVDMIVVELLKIRDSFFTARNDFLSDYENSLEQWMEKHSDWANIIRNSIVSADYVRARLDFRWQLYKVSPLLESEKNSAVTESGLMEEVTGLADTLFTEVSRSADKIWKKVYMGKTEVTHKALSPLRTLQKKLTGLSFVEPHVAPVAEIIKSAINRVAPKGNITGTDLLMLQGLVCLLRDSENLVLHSHKLIEGYGPATVLDSLIANSGLSHSKTGENLSVANPQIFTDEPVLPEIPVVPAKTVLPNLGLW